MAEKKDKNQAPAEVETPKVASKLLRKGRELVKREGGKMTIRHSATRSPGKGKPAVKVTIETDVFSDTPEGAEAFKKAVNAAPEGYRDDWNRQRLTDDKNGTVSGADPFKKAMRELGELAKTSDAAKARINAVLKEFGQATLD